MDLMLPIQNSLDALKFAISFNHYDLSEEQREALLNRCQQIQEILDKVMKVRCENVEMDSAESDCRENQ